MVGVASSAVTKAVLRLTTSLAWTLAAKRTSYPTYRPYADHAISPRLASERDAKLLHPDVKAWRILLASGIRDTI